LLFQKEKRKILETVQIFEQKIKKKFYFEGLARSFVSNWGDSGIVNSLWGSLE